MVYRVYVEKKRALADEAKSLKNDLKTLLGIGALEDVRVINRYDAENITEELFEAAIGTVFSEPQVDNAYSEIFLEDARVFAVEYLPGQFDQRADSAAQCIQIISRGERPVVRSAKVYALYGDLTDADVEKVKKYVINPVEAREASLEMPETLAMEYTVPAEVATVEGFLALDRAGLDAMARTLGLAMDTDDLAFCQS